MEKEKQLRELMDFGLERSVALEVLATHTFEQLETVLDFLTKYGGLIVNT